MTLRILVVDDHVIFREGLRALLQQVKGAVIVGESDNGHVAVAMARELVPDLVIVDVGIRELDGISATREILACCPSTRVIALSMQADGAIVHQMLEAGALGYVIKDAAFEELAQAIQAVMAKRTFVSPALKQALVQQVASGRRSPLMSLTAREREVLRVLAEGRTTKQAAIALGVSPKTIDTHRQHIMQKLGLQTIAELIHLAIREKLVSIDKLASGAVEG